jgi:predicted nucleic acid-binding Zn ribbon protein
MEIEIYFEENKKITKSIPLICKGDDGCGFEISIRAKATPSWSDPLAKCPECGEDLTYNISKVKQGIRMKGPGFHSTKIGQRQKRELTARNERLKKQQWDNHEPVMRENTGNVQNYTKGGPLDPNGPFAKKKSKPIVTYSKAKKKKD